MKRLAILSLLGVWMIAGAGCAGPQAVYEPKSTVLVSSEEALRDAIVRAVKARAWYVEEEKPGELLVVLSRAGGKRIVRAKIVYSGKDYTISLVDATEMDYDPETRTISRKYNQWIRNLDKAIKQAVEL